MIYSLYPAGHMSRYQYYIDSFQRSFLMGMPGLGTMLSQIPEYHIFNLIERIVNGIHSALPPADASSSNERESVASSVSSVSTAQPSSASAAMTSTSTALPTAPVATETAEVESDASASDSSDALSKSLSEKVLLPPYITNTVAHASECDLMVRTECARKP